uniref:alkaline phosphatase n=1 Tax=Timema douglasi TaxID=61478 RepID=A0A7R8VQG8_TIMDO|nr:unnamed protein product [Timema douglasi]
MEFEADRNPGPEGDPSLAEMTRTALHVMLKNPRGFFLFIEDRLPGVAYRGPRGGAVTIYPHYTGTHYQLLSACRGVPLLTHTDDLIWVLAMSDSSVLTHCPGAAPWSHPDRIFRYLSVSESVKDSLVLVYMKHVGPEFVPATVRWAGSLRLSTVNPKTASTINSIFIFLS